MASPSTRWMSASRMLRSNRRYIISSERGSTLGSINSTFGASTKPSPWLAVWMKAVWNQSTTWRSWEYREQLWWRLMWKERTSQKVNMGLLNDTPSPRPHALTLDKRSCILALSSKHHSTFHHFQFQYSTVSDGKLHRGSGNVFIKLRLHYATRL